MERALHIPKLRLFFIVAAVALAAIPVFLAAQDDASETPLGDIARNLRKKVPAQAVIEKRLDPARAVELGTEAAIARFDLPHKFAPAALREAQDYGDRVDPHRSRHARKDRQA